MNLLLDTHTVLWALSNDPTLSKAAREAIIDGQNQVFVSAASAWEIAIKRSLGKLRAPDNFEQELERQRFTPLPISCAHALATEQLPPHHQDPVDRMLVAQAKLEKLALVTRDRHILQYDVRTIEA